MMALMQAKVQRTGQRKKSDLSAGVEVIFKVKKDLLCLRNICVCTCAYVVRKPGFREESTE